jgi:hypothetical protein
MEVSGEPHALALLPPGKNSSTLLIRGSVGPAAGLDVSEKSFLLVVGVDLRIVQPVA